MNAFHFLLLIILQPTTQPATIPYTNGASRFMLKPARHTAQQSSFLHP